MSKCLESLKLIVKFIEKEMNKPLISSNEHECYRNGHLRPVSVSFLIFSRSDLI